ncbi:hypothetical protein AV530_009604 [Patagioenas fasciata monilis]|uniref:Uncharacterized protein n=1 Tax=Patagioenas fasciata monilis TaxID=372326 RepID=A0A1V4KNB6_PATFA|nr:hypothetical protein AV530_009604 [Patagioenas fasciata monilis]
MEEEYFVFPEYFGVRWRAEILANSTRVATIPGGRGGGRDPSLSALIYKDEKITVNQDVPVHEGKPHLVHFQYKVTEVKTSSWDAVLSNQSLFVEIPDGLLADGSKEGSLLHSHRGQPARLRSLPVPTSAEVRPDVTRRTPGLYETCDWLTWGSAGDSLDIS